MSLRDEAITHMARMVHALDSQENILRPLVWEAEPDKAWYKAEAEVALDALLDFLDAHTEEWAEDVPSAIGVSVKPFGLDKAIRFLVAALRGTTEEP